MNKTDKKRVNRKYFNIFFKESKFVNSKDEPYKDVSPILIVK